MDLFPDSGYFKISEMLGLGIEIDEEKMDKYTYKNIQYEATYLKDGTISEI